MNIRQLAFIIIPLSMAMVYLYFTVLKLQDYLSTAHLLGIIVVYRYIHEYVHLCAVPKAHKRSSKINHKYYGLILYVEAGPNMTKMQHTIFALAPFIVMSVLPLTALAFTGIQSTWHAVLAAVALFNAVGSSSDIQETWILWRGGQTLNKELLDRS